MTIPSDPKDFEKLKALAERNIARGDWGDEVSFPGDVVPTLPDQQVTRSLLKSVGGKPAPKKKT